MPGENNALPVSAIIMYIGISFALLISSRNLKMNASYDPCRCVNRVLVSKSCSPGLMWNEEASTCDFADNVDCTTTGGNPGGGTTPEVPAPPQWQQPPGISGGGGSAPPQTPGIPQAPARPPLHPGLDEVGDDFVVVENPALRREEDKILTSYEAGTSCTSEDDYMPIGNCSQYTR